VASRLLDPDDLAALEYSGLLDIGDLPEAKLSLAAEVAELDDFLADLGRRPPDESKMTYLQNELDDAFKGIHDTAIVFTQYTDTMEYLRDQLVTFYGDRVACWSGRGGERWSPTSKTWGPIAKADLKRLQGADPSGESEKTKASGWIEAPQITARSSWLFRCSTSPCRVSSSIAIRRLA
jgi:hypothetical protein